MRQCLLAVPLLLLTACALSEGLPATLPPPLTIAPGPALTAAGSCEDNRALSDWLQVSMDYAGRFATLVAEAGTRSTGDLYADVVMMGRMRAVVGEVATPDCAQPPQRMMMATMDRAIERFQAYVNGDADNLGNVVAETLGQIDQVGLVYAELLQRLEAQLQAQ